MSKRIEHCNCCDAETGRAGVHDDSLFHASEGPFCEECYESWPEEIINERDKASAETKRLREALEKIAAIEDEQFGGDWDEIEEAREIARAALGERP